MFDHVIVGVHITNRAERAGDVQQILTEYGRCIRTRLGLHPIQGEEASSRGLILLDLVGSRDDADAMCGQLRRLAGIQVQRMYFSEPE